MPSYRVTLTIGRLRPGTAPDAVLPAVASVAAELTVLEASSVNVVSGEARLTVRFTADDDRVALQVGSAVARAAESLAEVGGEKITRRTGSRWNTVAAAHREATLGHGFSAQQVRDAEAPLLAAGEPLMARAAAGLAAVAAEALRHPERRSTDRQRILVLAGPGNNGGDALLAAAELGAQGIEVVVAAVSDHLHPEGLAAAVGAGAVVLGRADLDGAVAAAGGADAILDGLFGTGSAGRATPSLSGEAADLVTALMPVLSPPERPTVIAVDIPSGIDADTGAVDGPVLPADVTVTFGALKAGLLRGPAAPLAGRIELVDIGLADQLARVAPLLRR